MSAMVNAVSYHLHQRWAMQRPAAAGRVSHTLIRECFSKFRENGCFLRSTDKTDNSQEWCGRYYLPIVYSLNNNNLLVMSVLFAVLFFIAHPGCLWCLCCCFCLAASRCVALYMEACKKSPNWHPSECSGRTLASKVALIFFNVGAIQDTSTV